MADPGSRFEVTNEDQAWEFLRNVLDSPLSDGRSPRVEFVGWPHVRIHLTETPVDGSISPQMMEAFIELQKTVYRAHTFVSVDSGDLRNLTKLDKENFEFRVKVEKGSSKYDVDLTTILEKLGAEALSKMDATHVVITVLGLALIIGGTVAFKAWLGARTDQRKSETQDREKQLWLEAQKTVSANDTERFRLLMKAMERQPLLSEVEASAEGARGQLVKAIADERGGTIGGIELTPEYAAEVVTQKRQQGQDTRLAGVYRVARVDTTSPEGFRVTLTDVETDQEVTATMQDALLSEDHRRVMREAEWNKKPVFVEMTARRLRSRIVDAMVINARDANMADIASARGGGT